MGARAILLIVAVVCFVLAAVDVDLGDLDLLAIGFAAFAGSFLVTDGGLARRH